MEKQTSYYHVRNIVEAYQFKDYQLMARKINASINTNFKINTEKCKKNSIKLNDNADYYLHSIQTSFGKNDIPKLREVLRELSIMVDYTYYKRGRAIADGKRKSKEARSV